MDCIYQLYFYHLVYIGKKVMSKFDEAIARVNLRVQSSPLVRDIEQAKVARQALEVRQLSEGMIPTDDYFIAPLSSGATFTEEKTYTPSNYGALDAVKDNATSLMQGLADIPDMAVTVADIADTLSPTNMVKKISKGEKITISDNKTRKWLADKGIYDRDTVQNYWDKYHSQHYQDTMVDIQRNAISQESLAGTYWEALKGMASNPSVGIPTFVRSVPSMVAGGLVGRGAKAVGASNGLAGGIGEGTVAGLQMASGIASQKGELTGKDALLSVADGVGTGLVGRYLGGSLNIETAVANGLTKSSIAQLPFSTGKEVLQESLQEGMSDALTQYATTGDVNLQQTAYGAGIGAGVGAIGAGLMATPSLLADTTGLAGKGVGKVKQQFQATHDDLINPTVKGFNPAQAYANAQTAFNRATTPEQQQQATEQMRQAEEAVYTGVSKFDELINNETDETKKKKLEEGKNKWLNSQVTTLNTITDAVQSEQDEGFSASSILDNYSKLGAIQAQQQQAQTNTNTDVDLSQVNRPTGDMVTPNTQATQTAKTNGYVKGKPVAIMGSYALKSDGKPRDTGAGTGDHYDIRLARDSKSGVKNGHRGNPVGYLNRFITSDGESLASARATSGYGMRNGRMHWGLDFGANGSFKQNQAKRTLLIAPEWEDRVVSLETKKDSVKYDKDGNRTDGGYYTRVTFDDGAVLHILHQDAKGQAQLKQAHGNATTNQQTNPVQATDTTVNSSWQGKRHRNISNNTTYDSKMSSIYSQYGFTLAEQQILKAQVGQESGFNAGAKNRGSGAFGLTQFIPSTAKQYGVKENDVDSMLHGQAKYMRYLLDRYKEDWAKALAGYNTGEGNVDSHWGKDGTGNGGGVMTMKWNRGKGETLLYVENILANAGAMTINGQGGNTSTVNNNTIQGSTDTTEQTNRLNDLLAQMDNETNTENLQKLQEQVNQLQEQIANANTTNTTNTQPEATQEQKQYAEQVEPQIIRRYSRMALDGDIDQAKAEIQQFQQAGVLSEEKANSLISLLDIKASIKSNTMSGVTEDIYNGSKHGDTALENNLGLKDYDRVFNYGNQKTINQYMDYLENFRDNHNAKSSILQQALVEFNTTGQGQYVGHTTDGWQFITQEQYDNKSDNETAYLINGRSQKLVNAVTNEAKAIDSFRNNWQTILNQKGNKPVQQNNNQQQQVQQQQQLQPKPVEPSTNVPTVPTTPKPVNNTNSAHAKTAQEMNDPNGVWVGRNGYGKDTMSMSQIDGNTQPFTGMFGNPFNTKEDSSWFVPKDQQLQKYKEKLAEYYSHSKKRWFRDAVESLRDKTLYTGMRNSSSAVEVQAISQFLEETKNMNDEQKLAYARALAQGGRDIANAIKSGKLDNTVSNRLGNTNTNTNTKSNQQSNQQQEPAFDENATLYFGDDNNQQQEPTFNENSSLNFGDDYDDVQQQLASRDENDHDIKLIFGDIPTTNDNEVIIDLGDVQETNDTTDTSNGIELGKDNDTGIDITKGVHTLLDMVEYIEFTDAQLLIANAVVNKYPDHTISFDGSNADISIKTTNPETVLARLVYLATRDVLSKDPTTSKAHENVHKYLDYVINKLSQYETTDPKEQELIQKLLQSKEALVALGTSHKEYIDLLKSIKTKERKVRNNLFSVIIHGFMSFLGVPSKATTTDLFEVLMANVGNAIDLQAQDNKSYVLSMVSDSATRKKEQDKPFDEQNLITSSFTQSTKGNLANVKSLSSRLIQKGIKEIKRLGIKAPNEKQEAQLKHYLKFEQQFKQALYNTFQSKKDEYKYQDLKQFLNIGTNENPVFDDNAITAMALSAYDYIALNGGSNYTSAEDIKVLLGLDKEALVPNYVLFKYKDAGISVNEVIIDLGKNAVKSLGLTAIETAPDETLQRLESSIGDWILTTMLENKLAYKNTYSQQELENDRANTLGHIPKELNANATKSTITLKPLDNPLDQVIDDITEMSKGTSGYLSSLYGSSTRRRNISLVPIEETIDKIDSTSSEVSKSQMGVIKRTQKEPIKLNQGMSSLLDYFLDKNEEMLHIMFGAKVYTEEELAQQGIHISERESMIKSAEGNLEALDSYLDLREGLPTRDTVFYDQIKTVMNNRMHYNSNVFNFQSEKVHRALGEYASFETEFDSENFINQKWTDDKGNPTAEAYFIRAIFENAEGTEGIFEKALKGKNLSEGYTVDKLSTENFMPIAWKYLTTNGKLKTAIRGIHNIQDGKKPTEPQLKAIQEVVAQWEMGANSFRALMEVANLHRAMQNNTTFVSSLGLGSDGVNSGTGIGMVQMGINDTLTLQRLGLFGKGEDIQTYFDTRNDTTIGDYYTAFKDYLLTEVYNLADETEQVDVLHALKALNTSLETRKMLKAILIPFGYGAGNPRLIRASAEQMIKDVYKFMSKIANEQDKDKATTAYNNLTTQLQGIFGDRFKLPPINELLEYEFNNKDYALLIEAYEVIMGEAISKAVKEYAKEFIERRNFNINIHNAISETYVKAREHLLEQAKQKHEAKLREEYKDATENELKRVLAYNTLSTQDIYEQVDKPLQKMFATVRTRHQVEDGLGSGSIEFVKPEKTFRQDISIQAITQIFNPKNKSNKDKTNQNVFIRDKVLTTTGVTPNSQMIQQQDAYVTSKAMVVNDEVSINVHDADIGKPTHYPSMAQAQNRAFFEGTAQYHMYSESIEALVSMIENITEVMGSDYVTSDVAIGLIESLLTYVPNVNTTGDLIQAVVNETITYGLMYDTDKIALLAGLGSIHQYAGEGGQVKLTDKDYEMLKEQRDVIKQHEEQLRKRIAKVAKEFKHKLDYHDETNQPVPTDIGEVVIYGDWTKNSITATGNINQAINALDTMFPNKKHSKFHIKKYIEVVSSDAVYVVAPIKGKATVSGGANTTVNIAKKLDKPLYVYDVTTQTWYKYQPVLKRFIPFNKPVVLTPKATVTGKSDLEYIVEKEVVEISPTFMTDVLTVLNEVYDNTRHVIETGKVQGSQTQDKDTDTSRQSTDNPATLSGQAQNTLDNTNQPSNFSQGNEQSHERQTEGNGSTSTEVAYDNAKALIDTLDSETKDKLRTVVKEVTKVDKPTYKQVAQYLVQYALNTVQDIVEHLNPSSELSTQAKLYHYLWQRVQQLNPNLRVVTRDDFPDSTEEGYYDAVENTIYLNKKVPDNQKIRVLNHEIFHALTETGLTQDTQAGRELKAIYNYLKGKASGKFTNQLQDINEFVAYAMTDKVFMDWVVKTMDLKEIGIKAKLANKLQYFVSVVMKALGLSKYKANVNTLTQLINDVMVEYDPDNIGNVIHHSQRQEATDRVNSTNTLDIFKNLPTNVSEAHNEHLNYVVDNIIGTYQNTHSKPMVNIANGKLRNTSLLNGFKSSDKEAYITDALIIVFESYLKAHTGNMAVNGLNNLYRDAIKQYASVKDLFPNFATASKEDKAQMVKMYNFIFNNKTKQDNVARFMAMSIANEQFRQLMQSSRKPMRDNTTWFDKAIRVLDKVVNWFNRVYFRSKSNKHSDITDAMTKRLVDLDIKARNTSVDWFQVSWTKALEFTGKVLDKPVKKLGYLLMDKVIKQFAGSTGKLGTLGSFAKLQSDVKTLKDLEKENAELDGGIPLHESVVNRLLSKTYGDERYKIIRDTINEVTMYGKRGKWIENMVRLTQSIGKVRQAMKESTIRVFDEVFETPLTKEQKSDITKVVLITELSSLVRHGFSIEKVASMFEQATLNKTIDNYAKQLIKKVGYAKANDMLMQSKALGYYMAKESTVRNMTKSAQGIAVGLGTDYQTDFSNMDNDVFMLVDVLSTLYALDYTDKSARQSVKALLENEPLAMNTVLQLQKGLVDKGRDEFEHNPLNYQKGYTPQITNPYRKLVWVTTQDEIKMLKAQGFEVVTKLTKDKLDDTDQSTLMLHTAYSPNNYVSGGLDLADSHARGTAVYKQGINDREIAKVTKANIAMRKQRNQGSYMNYDPSVDRNAMVATYATDGAILDYHYEMEGNTRDTYLERDNSFDELMGTLHGNLEFKPQIREHQANIAKEIFREAKANFAKSPNEFVLLDFDNPDPVVQETMKLLPYSFRKEIIKHFGDGVVPVHKSVYTSMFGFRAYSIANMFDKLHDPEQKLNHAEKLITGIFRAFSKEKARQRAVQLEKLIQDFMSVIKDYIVIRTGGVLMGNIISNILLLSLHGVNPVKILQDSIFAWRNSNRYTKTQAKVNDLNTRLLGLTNKQEIGLIKRELEALQRELENNPMHEFMQAGLMSTIVEDLTNQENKYKTPIQESMDKYLNKIPKPIRSTISSLTIDKGTLLHNFLSDATQFSDLSAKYVLAKHNMDKGMDLSNAIYESQINFINYDMPTNQFLDYMNRMGFMIFTKFFLRFQQVMLKLFNKMPITALAQHYAIEQLGGQGIYEPFIFSRFGNPFDDSIFMADNAFADAIITDLVF